MARDPIELEIFKNLYHSIAEEMGGALRRTAFSPNIKERRDYSCAVFDEDGEVIAMGDHMPVHLGSMPMSVRAAVERLAFEPGDIAMLNDREGDLSAQIAACHTGATRLGEICRRYGLAHAKRLGRELLDYSEEMMRAFLSKAPRGEFRAEDFLDDDGVSDRPVKIAVSIKFHSSSKPQRRSRAIHVVSIDFTGTDPQVQGSVNAVEAITYSACFYVFRCLLAEDVPATAGLMGPIQVIAPPGTADNDRPPAAVTGGNA